MFFVLLFGICGELKCNMEIAVWCLQLPNSCFWTSPYVLHLANKKTIITQLNFGSNLAGRA